MREPPSLRRGVRCWKDGSSLWFTLLHEGRAHVNLPAAYYDSSGLLDRHFYRNGAIALWVIHRAGSTSSHEATAQKGNCST